MAWILNNDKPIYIQIVEKITRQIISGEYKPGDKIESVRELAQLATVNPNTMQKAMAELERNNLILTNRTNGRYVTEDLNIIENLKKEIAKEIVIEYISKISQLGYTKEDYVNFVETYIPQ